MAQNDFMVLENSVTVHIVGVSRGEEIEYGQRYTGKVFYIDSDFASKLHVGDVLSLGYPTQSPQNWLRGIEGDSEELRGVVIEVTKRTFSNDLFLMASVMTIIKRDIEENKP